MPGAGDGASGGAATWGGDSLMVITLGRPGRTPRHPPRPITSSFGRILGTLNCMRILRALTYDIVLVFLFAAIGRLSHGEDLSRLGATAWPFLMAAIVGSLVASWRQGAWWVQGLTVWVVTAAGGVVLRLVSGGTAEVSFVLVTAAVLAVFLLGWRVLLRKQL